MHLKTIIILSFVTILKIILMDKNQTI